MFDLDQKSFRGLLNVETLDLKSNDLTDLPIFISQDLINLKFLNLSQNFIRILESNMFKSQLKELNLANNLLSLFSNNTFLFVQNLEKLLLNDNQLEFMDSNAFNGLGDLSVLKLNNNKIKY